MGTALVQSATAKGYSPQAIRTELLTKLSDLQAQVAIELSTWPHTLQQSTAAELHNAGVRGGSYQGAPIQVSRPAASGPPGAGRITR
jgi:hypothetical protein